MTAGQAVGAVGRRRAHQHTALGETAAEGTGENVENFAGRARKAENSRLTQEI